MKFELKAVRAPGGVVALTFDAVDELDAKSQAGAQGYSVLTVKAKQSWRPRMGSRRGQFPLLLFSQELLALLNAGLTVVEGIETLAEKEARPESRSLLQQIVAHLYEGRSLSYALQSFPAVFPHLYVSTIRASEKTGDLGEALTRYIAYQTQVDLVRKKVVSASIYPLLLIGAGGLVTLFLLAYVVPRFSRIYEDIGTNLPLLSRLLLQWGKLLHSAGPLVLIALALALAAAIYLGTRPATRNWVMQRLWRLPAAGERMRVYQLARFYRTLGMLLRGGTPVGAALKMVSDLLQPELRLQLQGAASRITEGRSISYAMETHGLTTPVALRMLRVGERTGQMGEMMERIAGFYDEEMARWVEWFTRLFEPLLMALIGVVIGAIVILMYLPIFELAGSLQ
ncbi:MAG: type II secretion system F family protein [Betaproteobacteria bacterium]|nr:type II secretion system F family protein [Betaproteobacteria bacterium]